MHISLKHVLEKTNSITKIIITLQNQDSMFRFYLNLSLEVLLAGLSASVGIVFSFSLGAPSTGIVIEAKACSKLWEVALSCGTSAALSEDVSFKTSGSFDCSC